MSLTMFFFWTAENGPPDLFRKTFLRVPNEECDINSNIPRVFLADGQRGLSNHHVKGKPARKCDYNGYSYSVNRSIDNFFKKSVF